MKKLLLILSLVLFSTPSFGEWSIASVSSDKTVFYVDFSTIRKQGNYTYFWNVADYVEKQLDAGRGVSIFSSRSYTKANCEHFSYYHLQTDYYTSPMAEGNSYLSGKNTEKDLTYAPPGSSFYGVLEEVCKRAN